MKILLVSEFFPSKDKIFLGGVQARTFYVAKYLAEKHNITVITNREKDKKKREKIGNLKILRVGFEFKYPYATSRSIFKRLYFVFSAVKIGRKLEFDLVEGSNFVSHFAAFAIGFLKNKPKIAWYPDVLIGSWLQAFGLISGLVGELSERIILKFPWDRVIAISNSTAFKLRKRGVPQKKIAVIGCGIDFEEFQNPVVDRKKEPIVITVARLVSYKRVGDLIVAFAEVKKKVPQAKLYIIGDGPEYKNLQENVKILKLKKDVEFFINLPRASFIKTLSQASLFVLPSAIEGFGIAIIEAAALKIPYVATDLPVTREVTKNGQGGMFFHVGNIDELAEKILLLLSDDNLREKFSGEAYLLSQNYSWEKIASATQKLYEKTTKKRQEN